MKSLKWVSRVCFVYLLQINVNKIIYFLGVENGQYEITIFINLPNHLEDFEKAADWQFFQCHIVFHITTKVDR